MSSEGNIPQSRPLKYNFQIFAENGPGIVSHTVIGITRFGAENGIMWFWSAEAVLDQAGTYAECVKLCIPVHKIYTVKCIAVY